MIFGSVSEVHRAKGSYARYWLENRNFTRATTKNFNVLALTQAKANETGTKLNFNLTVR